MTEPPKLRYHRLSAQEMELLYQQNDFDGTLAVCSKLSFPEPQGQLHETFCCKKEIIRYIDSDDEERALIILQTDAHDSSKNRRILRRLRVGNDVYDLKLP